MLQFIIAFISKFEQITFTANEKTDNIQPYFGITTWLQGAERKVRSYQD